MRTRRVIIGCVAVLASAWACGLKEPIAPPNGAGSSSPPRTDGLYASKVESGKGGFDLLRFMAPNKVVSISTTGAVEAAAAVLYGKDLSQAGSGTFEVNDGVLRFTLKSKQGSVEYAGVAKDDKLVVKWHSSINDVVNEESFTFVNVVDENAGDAADAGAGAPSADEEPTDPGALAPPPGPTGAPPPPPPPPPDLDAGAPSKPDAGRTKKRRQNR